MTYTRVITGFALIGALVSAPVFAGDEGQRERSDRRGGRTQQGDSRQGDSRQGGDRATSRSRSEGRQNDNAQRQSEGRQRQDQSPRQYQPQQRQQDERQQQYQAPRQSQRQQYQPPRQYDTRRDNSVGRAVPRPYYSNRGYDSNRSYGYGPRSYSSRIIRPRIVTVIPYRPYVYRPHFGLGIFYGAGGFYEYGNTPRGYYDPLPGRIYGGLRITGASRDAQVFADGYYVGIVDDFDGIFQHVNLEAGEHHIEIQEPGEESVGFDVVVQPGRTITFRADTY